MCYGFGGDIDLDLDGQAGLEPRQARRPPANRPHEPARGVRAAAAHGPVRDCRSERAAARPRRHHDPAPVSARDSAPAAPGGNARRGGPWLEHAVARFRGGRIRGGQAQELQPLPRAGPGDRIAARPGGAADAPVGHGGKAAAGGGQARKGGLGGSRVPARRGPLFEAGEAAGSGWDRGRDLPGGSAAPRGARSPADGWHPGRGPLRVGRRRCGAARPVWVTVYSHLVKLETELLDVLAGTIAKMPSEAQREAEQTNLPVLASQVERFRHRLEYWVGRKNLLEGRLAG